jgi:hypothetical protein
MQVQQRRSYAKPRVRRAPKLEPVSPYPLEKWVEVAESYEWKEVDPAFFRKCFISWHDAYQSGGTDEQYNRVMQGKKPPLPFYLSLPPASLPR